MDPVLNSLYEVEGLMSSFKEQLADKSLVLQLARGQAAVSMIQDCWSVDRLLIDEREKLDTTASREYETFCSMLEERLATIGRQWLDEVRDLLRDTIQQERTIYSAAYSKVTEQSDAHLTEDQEKMDNVLKQLQIQFDMLLNEQSKLKSVMESWMKAEVGGNLYFARFKTTI